MGCRSRRRRLIRHYFAGTALAFALAACSPGPAESSTASASDAAAVQDVHPESGLPVIELSVAEAGGEVDTFRVEVASSRMEQARGLMFRTKMGANEGMLFPFERPREASFWMKNTVIPLDIIFIGADGRILNVAAKAVPYSEDQVLSEGEAAAVLELNGGRAAQLGIAAGDRVSW